MSALPLSLEPVNPGVFRVLDAQGDHVGYLKQMGGQWKFKAVGYTLEGAVVPGGGPLTEQHNRVVARPAPDGLAAALADGAGVQTAPGRS